MHKVPKELFVKVSIALRNVYTAFLSPTGNPNWIANDVTKFNGWWVFLSNFDDMGSAWWWCARGAEQRSPSDACCIFFLPLERNSFFCILMGRLQTRQQRVENISLNSLDCYTHPSKLICLKRRHALPPQKWSYFPFTWIQMSGPFPGKVKTKRSFQMYYHNSGSKRYVKKQVINACALVEMPFGASLCR